MGLRHGVYVIGTGALILLDMASKYCDVFIFSVDRHRFAISHPYPGDGI